MVAVGGVGGGAPSLHDLGPCQAGSRDGDHSCKHMGIVLFLQLQKAEGLKAKEGAAVGKLEVTLLQDGAVRIDGLVDDGLSVSGLCHLLALHADLLPLRSRRETGVNNQSH